MSVLRLAVPAFDTDASGLARQALSPTLVDLDDPQLFVAVRGLIAGERQRRLRVGSLASTYGCSSRAMSSSDGGTGRQCRRTHRRSIGSAKL